MADASAGGATKSSAKSAKSDAQKFYKKKPDPEGAKLIEQGEEALKAGDFDKAKALFDKATEVCKSSTAQAEKPKKEPKPPAAEGEAVKKDRAWVWGCGGVSRQQTRNRVLRLQMF